MTGAKRKQFTAIILCLVLLAVSATFICCFANGNVANAQTTEIQEEQAAEPRGLTTTISIKLATKDGSVYAIARNDFTLGISTIQVYVELYSSTTYTESISDMRLESSNYTADLNIYKTLEASTPIAGVQKYWKARVRYKMDNQSWVAKETGTFLIGTDGSVIK